MLTSINIKNQVEILIVIVFQPNPRKSRNCGAFYSQTYLNVIVHFFFHL